MVAFTDLVIAANQLLCPRKYYGVIPASWDRYMFTRSTDVELTVYQLDRWLLQNMTGRWASYIFPEHGQSIARVVVRFEKPNDALMFKLKDGENEAFE